MFQLLDKITKFESNSQLTQKGWADIISFSCWTKLQNLKAIHNGSPQCHRGGGVSVVGQNYKI